MGKSSNMSIPYFPIMYEDEIFYSIISRYHLLTGNKNYKDTLKEIFGKESVIPTVEFPSNLYYLENSVLKDINIEIEDIIFNHTLLPFYYPFLNIETQRYIMNRMKNHDGKGIKYKIGFVAGSICKKEGLMYCSECVKEDIEKLGEAYFHRIHQVQGVYVCPKHKCYLKKYPISNRDRSRIEFINLDCSFIDFEFNIK